MVPLISPSTSNLGHFPFSIADRAIQPGTVRARSLKKKNQSILSNNQYCRWGTLLSLWVQKMTTTTYLSDQEKRDCTLMDPPCNSLTLAAPSSNWRPRPICLQSLSDNVADIRRVARAKFDHAQNAGRRERDSEIWNYKVILRIWNSLKNMLDAGIWRV